LDVAVTDWLAFIVTWQAPEPWQAPAGAAFCAAPDLQNNAAATHTSAKKFRRVTAHLSYWNSGVNNKGIGRHRRA
jgi:hypothetical protein